MIRALGGLVATIVLMLSVVASPAQAADELGLSSDGQTWSGNLPGALLDPAVRWVPGDVRQAEFYVRNQADDGGTLTVAMEARDADRLLRDEDIQLSARVGSEAWVVLAPGGQAFRLSDPALPADSVRKVEVNANFDPASGNWSQRSTTSFIFRVTLSGAGSTSGGEQSDGTRGPDGSDGAQELTDAAALPNTGAPVLGWWTVATSVAMGVGFSLMKNRRREEVSRHGTAR